MTLRKTFPFIFALAIQTNHPPVVKIESPTNHVVVARGAQLSYVIHVADQEDGDSRYDEINPKEVLLEMRQWKTGSAVPQRSGSGSVPQRSGSGSVPQSSGSSISQNSGAAADAGLNIMAGNNCLNCHLFKAKLLGPSFFDIAARYPATKVNIDTLSRRVRDGSAGVWGGSEKMPSHPELSAAAVRSAVQWILRNGARRDRTFFNGISGLLRFPEDKPGTYVLTAYYTDHGLKDQPGQRLQGSDRVLITVK